MALRFLLLAALAATCSSQDAPPDFLSQGQCDSTTIQRNFDLSRMSGTWYQTYKTNVPMLPLDSCVRTEYRYNSGSNELRARTTGFNMFNERKLQEGRIFPKNPQFPAEMEIDFPGEMPAPFRVVATDYVSYACVYSCMPFLSLKAEVAFVYSRTPNPQGPGKNECSSLFRRMGMPTSGFKVIPHQRSCYQ